MTTLSTRIDGHAIRPAFTHLLPHPTPLPVSKGGESTTLPVYVHRPRAHHDSADIIGGVQAPQTLLPRPSGRKPAEARRGAPARRRVPVRTAPVPCVQSCGAVVVWNTRRSHMLPVPSSSSIDAHRSFHTSGGRVHGLDSDESAITASETPHRRQPNVPTPLERALNTQVAEPEPHCPL